MQGVNLVIYNYILEEFRKEELASFHPPRPLHKMSKKKTDLIKMRMRNNFDGLKVASRLRRTLTVDERREIARVKNQKARLNAVSTIIYN